MLGPIQFIAYTTDSSDTFTGHNLLYHMFADDTQMYDHCLISNVPVLVNNLTACINDLQKSFSSHRLQLNPTKTEFIWFGTRTTLLKIPAAYRSLPVGSSVVQSCEVVRDLGV